ncbi:MAG: hypothetical protein LBG21_05245 [Campylobacteraceae bacterium]|jgi:hypothetical protein|nr:hypothetical protein [Campylobacteraceae bacterium]
MKKKFIVVCCILAVFSGCAVKVGVDANKTLDGDYNLTALKNALTHGDWLVARGVHETDNFMVGVTNMPLSHAAIYDMDNDEVIEADGEVGAYCEIKGFFGRIAKSDGDSADVGKRTGKDNCR